MATESNPWGEDFDAEKAWSLVVNLRADKERLREQLADSQATTSTLQTKLTSAQDELTATKENLTKTQRETNFKELLRAHELTEEEANDWLSLDMDEDTLKAKAERLAKLLGKGSKEAEGDQEQEEQPTGGAPAPIPLPKRPAPVPGNGGGSPDPEPDYAALAAKIAANQ